jgi:hypothetical protein
MRGTYAERLARGRGVMVVMSSVRLKSARLLA